MTNRIALQRTLALLVGGALTCSLNTGFAFDMGNMMNPSKWMGGGRDRDYYDEGPWGGPGYGGPGYGYGVPGGYGGAPGYGYGVPGGYGGGPGYGYGAPGGYGGAPAGYSYGAPGGYGGGPGYGYGAPAGYGGQPPAAPRPQ